MRSRGILVLLLSSLITISSLCADFPVTNSVTSLADSGTGTLRDLISSAQESGVPTKIVSSVSGTITLGSSLPVITTPLWLELPGLTLSGSISNGALNVQSAALTRISGLTLSKLTISLDNAPLVNSGSLWLEFCNFLTNVNNSGYGGALLNKGDLIVTNCNFAGNLAQGKVIGNSDPNAGGGAIFQSGGSLNVYDSVIAFNKAAPGATYVGGPPIGGLFSDGTTFGQAQGAGLSVLGGKVTLERTSVISNNLIAIPPLQENSAHGGGIYCSSGNIILINCTIAGNAVAAVDSLFDGRHNGASLSGDAWGAGISLDGGTLFATHTTITGNKSIAGRGVAGYTQNGFSASGGIDVRPTAELHLTACIIAGNEADYGKDILGAYVSGGGNIFGDASGTASLIPADLANASNIVLPVQLSSNNQWYAGLSV